MKRKEILACATTWVTLEDMMLSARSQLQKDIVRFHLYEAPGVVKSIETESRSVVARSSGRGQ